jgi:predicted phosphoribosyltransferase
MEVRFRDRIEAGQRLALALERFRSDHPLVLGLARGGVIVGAEVAKHLGSDLDVMVARKVAAPLHPELAIGVVAGGIVRLDEEVIAPLGLPRVAVLSIVMKELDEAKRRASVYRGGRSPISIGGRTVILVDDGLATGWTARVSLEALRQSYPSRLIFAAPVWAPDSDARLGGLADEVVCLVRPSAFLAVGAWYDDFAPTIDGEVIDALDLGLPASVFPGRTRD